MRKVMYKILSAALCLTMLVGCSKDVEKETEATKANGDVEITSEAVAYKETDKVDSDGATAENSAEPASEEPKLSPIAYSNCIIDAGASAEILSDTSAININKRVLNYNDVFGVGVDEDSLVPIDSQIQINSVYFDSQGDGNETITVSGNFSVSDIKAKTDLFLNLYIVDLATGEIINFKEERTYTINGQEITGSGYCSYSTVSAGSVEFQFGGLIPSGYRDLGILICDAETLPLSEAQHNCKDVIDYTNVSEIAEGNKTLLVFDLNQFGESDGYLYWPSSLLG
ncbi:MAG: hypothetical protein MJ153_06915 [Clostridia bacterium]|nr:hypothetical protein [Clostridia bacterium]